MITEIDKFSEILDKVISVGFFVIPNTFVDFSIAKTF